jgi:hypothetical protein
MIKRHCTKFWLTLPLLLTGIFASLIATTAAGPPSPERAAGKAAPSIDGHWEGVLDREGAKMTVRFDFKTEGRKTSILFSSDSWMVMDWPVGEVKYAPPKFHFDLAGDSGNNTAFDGEVDIDTIVGRFVGSEGEGSFSLRRVASVLPPYKREDVSFHNGGVTLAGTLLIPRTQGHATESTGTDRGLLGRFWSVVSRSKCEAPGAPISVDEPTSMAPRSRRQSQNPPLQKSSAIPA